MLINLGLCRYVKYSSILKNSRMLRSTTTNSNDIDGTSTVKTGGFAKAYEKQSHMLNADNIENQTFPSLFRYSKLTDLGDPFGKIVTGKIFHVVKDDLYIDFGWKFHCVCTRPTTRADEYVRGARVRIHVNDLELSSRFLGSSTDLTLLESDCKLLGLVSSPARATITQNDQ